MPQTESETTQQTHLLAYLRVLARRRWTILGILVLAGGTGAFMSAMTVPLFEARSQLVIEFERPQVVLFDQKAEGDDTTDYQVTQVKILQSRTLAARTLEALKLWEHPEFGGGTQQPQEPTGIGAVASGVRGWVESLPSRFSRTPAYAGGKYIAEPDAVNLDAVIPREESESQTRAIDRFVSRLKAVQQGESHLVEVRFLAAEPRLAAAVVNQLTAEYILQNQEFKKKVSVESADWLGEQLEEHRKQLRDSQTALQQYRERTAAVGVVDPAEVERKLEQANTALSQAQTLRLLKEAAAQAVDAADGDAAALARVPAIATNSTLTALRQEIAGLRQQDLEMAQTLGARHPSRLNVQLAIQAAERRLADELVRAVDVIRSDYRTARADEERLKATIADLRREEVVVRARQVESDGLTRVSTTDQKIFETLLERAKETNVTTKMVASNIRVVDPASVPFAPVSPNRRTDLLVSLFFGLLLALSTAFFLEYMDKSIKSPDEIKSQLGLTCMGIVPIVTKGPLSLKASSGMPSDFIEAFRTIRTNVLLASADESVRTILVTSTRPGEGKTVVAANLATLLAQTGQSVVLVDADLRRPRVHEVLEQPLEPGLSDLALGRLKPSRVIHETSVPGLWCVPAGPIPPNPAEILSSEPFADFIKVLGKAFDWVIVDSAPVMAVTDATLVARVVSGVLFVVAADRSTGAAALKAIEQLEMAHSRFVGAVLNKVNLKRQAFYYSDYYRREYGRYYGPPDGPMGDKPGASWRWPRIFGPKVPASVADPAAPAQASSAAGHTSPPPSGWGMGSLTYRRFRRSTGPRA